MSGGKFRWYGGVTMGRRVRRRKRPLTEKQTFSDHDIDLWIEWLKRLKSGGDLHSAGLRWHGNWRMMVYWLAAATLTACVTYTGGRA